MNAPMEMIWPDIFIKEEFGGSHASLCSAGLCAWGNVMCGARPPENFGKVMVRIGEVLQCSPTGDGLMEYAKANFPEKDGAK